MPVLILDGVELVPLQLVSSLIQDYPASCIFYIIGADPLLPSLQQTPHVSEFVDEWSMGQISAVSNLIHNFEQASGQQINRGKSALIPARQLSDDERASCLALWYSDIRISSRERVLGVFIGIHVSIHDQYYNGVHKFDVALSVFGRVRMSLSLAMRVLVVNIFMFTLFSYPNRQFFMPRVLLQEIERKVLRFLTPITWTKLGMFSAVGALCGTQLFLQDLRLSNLLCCMAWCHIRELVWHWLDTQSRLKVVAAGRDPWLQSGLDFGTAEVQNLLYILYIDEEHHAYFESICWYLPSPSESSASFSDEC